MPVLEEELIRTASRVSGCRQVTPSGVPAGDQRGAGYCVMDGGTYAFSSSPVTAAKSSDSVSPRTVRRRE